MHDSFLLPLASPLHLPRYWASRIHNNVTSIDLSGSLLTPDLLEGLAASPAAPGLLSLKLNISFPFGDRLESFSSLRELGLVTDLDRRWVDFAAIGQHLPQIETLDLSPCHHQNKGAVLELVETLLSDSCAGWPNLATLHFPKKDLYNFDPHFEGEFTSLLKKTLVGRSKKRQMKCVTFAAELDEQSSLSRTRLEIQKLLQCPDVLAPSTLKGNWPCKDVTALLDAIGTNNCAALRSIGIHSCTPNTVGPAVDVVSERCPLLEELTLATDCHMSGGYCCEISDFGPILPSGLKKFSVEFAQLPGPTQAAVFSSFPSSLVELQLSATSRVRKYQFPGEVMGSKFVAILIRCCPHLERLRLNLYVEIGQGNLEDLIAGLPELRHLVLGCLTDGPDFALPSSARLRTFRVEKGKPPPLGYPFDRSLAQATIGDIPQAPRNQFGASIDRPPQSSEMRLRFLKLQLRHLSRLPNAWKVDLQILNTFKTEESNPNAGQLILKLHEPIRQELESLSFAKFASWVDATTCSKENTRHCSGSQFPLHFLSCFSNVTHLSLSSSRLPDEELQRILTAMPHLFSLQINLSNSLLSLDWLGHPRLVQVCVGLAEVQPFLKPLDHVISGSSLPALAHFALVSPLSRDTKQSKLHCIDLPHLHSLEIRIRPDSKSDHIDGIEIANCPSLVEAIVHSRFGEFVLVECPMLADLDVLPFQTAPKYEERQAARVVVEAPALRRVLLSRTPPKFYSKLLATITDNSAPVIEYYGERE